MSDDAGDQEPGSEPSDTGDSRPKARARTVKAPPPDVHDRWWALYRDGARSLKKLAKAARISPSTAQHAISVGWPEAQFAPFRDRAQLHDQATARAVQREVAAAEARLTDADRDAATTAAKAALGTWAAAAKHALESLTSTSLALAQLGQKINEATGAANFVRHRPVPDVDAAGAQRRDKNGRPMTVLRPYVDAYRHALATLVHIRASREHAQLVRTLLGDIKPIDPKTGEAGHIPGLLSGHTVVSLYMPPNGRENENPEDEIDESVADDPIG